MAERGLRLKLGAFLVGTLAVLAGLVIFFGRAPDLFTNKASYTVIFPEAPGIGPGTPIRKSGVRIGEVTGLELEPTGQVHIYIRVDRKFLPRKNEEATITKGLLNGDAAIDFLPKLAEEGQTPQLAEEYPPGAVIIGIPPITPRSLLMPASSVLASAQQSLDRIVKAFEKLEKLERLSPKIETTLDEFTGLAKDLRGFIPDLRKTNERFQNILGTEAGQLPADLIAAQQPLDQPNVRNLIHDLQELVRSIRPAVDDVRGTVRRLEPELTNTVRSARQSFDSVNEILTPENRKLVTEMLKNINGLASTVIKITASLNTLLDSTEKTVKNIDTFVLSSGEVVADVRAITKPLALRSETLVTSITESADQLSKTLADVRLLLKSFGNGNGSLQKLLGDPNLYQNLDEASASLARVMARTEKIMRDLEVFADKIARRPELIGVGGALRPSSGLKDAPNASFPSYRPDWPPALPARALEPTWLLPPAAPPALAPPPPSMPTDPSTPLPPVQGYPVR